MNKVYPDITIIKVDGSSHSFFNEQVDHKLFEKFLNSTPPMVEDTITNIGIDPNTPTWIFYPKPRRNGKIDEDDVTILTFHKGIYKSVESEYVAPEDRFELEAVDQPLAQGVYNGKKGYWEIDMRGDVLPEFVLELLWTL